MTGQSVLPVSQATPAIAAGNEKSPDTILLSLQEDLAGTYHSFSAQGLKRSSTMLAYGLQQFSTTWDSPFDKDLWLHTVDSMQINRLPNTPTGLTNIKSSRSISLANDNLLTSLTEPEGLLRSVLKMVLASNSVLIAITPNRTRFLSPQTPVAERIDELILVENGQEDLLLERQLQAEWLKHVMASRWATNLPQPFIAYDLDEGLFVASWQSDTECNTLTIDAKARKGWYDPWPASENDNPLPGEIDLEADEAWRRLLTALTTTRP